MLAPEPDIEVAGEAGSGDEAVTLARSGGYDVILMDLRMPGTDGVAAIGQILARDPAARIVVLTTYETDADILRAVEAGAAGYLLKDSPRAEVANAIRVAARGETVLAPSVAARLVTQVRRPQRDSLSAREVEVLATGRPGHDQRRHRPAAVHQRGDRQDTPAQGVRQARRLRPDRRRDHGDRAG